MHNVSIAPEKNEGRQLILLTFKKDEVTADLLVMLQTMTKTGY